MRIEIKVCSCDLDAAPNTQTNDSVSDYTTPPESLENVLALDQTRVMGAVAGKYGVITMGFCALGLLDSCAQPATVWIFATLIRGGRPEREEEGGLGDGNRRGLAFKVVKQLSMLVSVLLCTIRNLYLRSSIESRSGSSNAWKA